MRFESSVGPAVIAGAVALAIAGTAWGATRAREAATGTPPASAAAATPWTARGGDVALRWNADLAGDLGMRLVPATVAGTRAADGAQRFAVVADGGLRFKVDRGYLRAWSGGAVQARGGWTLRLHDGVIDLDGFRLVPKASPLGRSPEFDLVGRDGVAWFTIDRVMHEVFDGGDKALTISSSDVRISRRLAERLGHPYAEGWAIAEMQLDMPVATRGSGAAPRDKAPTIRWHGDPAPDGVSTYQNDLFMLRTTAQYLRCSGCTGNAGSGRVVITPSSTLKNNVNQGSIAATVPNDPLGTSRAKYAASIPWYQKFSGTFAPYGNDQHPYLIWNMYRINADGSLEQIGRSGVKQAYLTTNELCLDPNDHNSHVLGRGCIDTYSSGNNDYTQGLSPRSEILPATGTWGRCGSTFDPSCTGTMQNQPGNEYTLRMSVGESQIAPPANTGARWMLESWYLAKDDIDIYNSMSTLLTTQTWTGAVWNVQSSQERLGSAIDRWFKLESGARERQVARPSAAAPQDVAAKRARERDPTPLAPVRHLQELLVDGARAKLAVKVQRLGNGQWRYHYALMNFEFAFGTASGAAPNVRVSGNHGFDAFTLETGSGAQATAAVFRDGDLAASNDWTFETLPDGLRWRNASGGNTLWWGTLFSFSITSPKAPIHGYATLGADTQPATAHRVLTIVPRD